MNIKINHYFFHPVLDSIKTQTIPSPSGMVPSSNNESQHIFTQQSLPHVTNVSNGKTDVVLSL